MTTPDLSDKYPHVDFLNLQFINFGTKGFFSGKIETAICPDDNSKVESEVKLKVKALCDKFPIYSQAI